MLDEKLYTTQEAVTCEENGGAFRPHCGVWCMCIITDIISRVVLKSCDEAGGWNSEVMISYYKTPVTPLSITVITYVYLQLIELM